MQLLNSAFFQAVEIILSLYSLQLITYFFFMLCYLKINNSQLVVYVSGTTRTPQTLTFLFQICYFNVLYFSKITTESEAEESGDEGADGPDEDPPMGHQHHADDAQMTRK